MKEKDLVEIETEEFLKKIYSQRNHYIDLFCKTFLCVNSISEEEMKLIFKHMELEISLMDNPVGWKIKLNWIDKKLENDHL